MKKIKTLIIYFSFHHKNTQKVARTMAEVLKASLVEAPDFNPASISDYDLIGFGSGIYFFKHHKSLFKILKEIKPQKEKKAFIFSTSGAPNGQRQHKKLKKALIKKGFKIIGEFNCLGWDSFGPLRLIGGINKDRPNDKDLKEAKIFAKSLLEKF
jgi:flavodoxin